MIPKATDLGGFSRCIFMGKSSLIEKKKSIYNMTLDFKNNIKAITDFSKF